ncbi:TolC family protein [Daejeonella oryzae]|uniref:TolC family protein n=1 Tax=Daejeonella oryzae TaxID=1122943 RepID=UPI00040894D9|nr:TolC family protein [Daejeonella oryzae]
MNLNFFLKSILTGSFIFLFVQSNAQEQLSLEQAVQIALQNNYDIKLNAVSLDIRKTNVSQGLSAMYPVVTGNFNTNNTIQNTSQTLSSGQLQERDGAKNSSLSYGPVLNWRVFDGFEMFARYDQLKELQKLEESNLRQTIQQTLVNVISNYYDLVQQQQQISALNTALEISRIRLKNSQSRYQIGKAAKLEVLAASVDLNSDTTNLLRQKDQYRNTKTILNELLARDVNIDFTVADTIIISNNLILDELQKNAATLNPNLQAAVINQRIAELNLKQVRANRYPDINLNTGYNFSNSTSELGFARESRGRGLNYGVSASINIFSGFLQKKNEKVAGLEIDNSRLLYEKANLSINAQLVSLYQTYLTNIELVKLEKQNQDVAKQNLDITLEKFRLGTVVPLEFREAQRNYINSNARYTNAQYLAKLAEITLKQIAGTLSLQ